MSGCKINQNMEFGDIIYFILLLFFVILGFFNDSRKKKQREQVEAQQLPEVEFPPIVEDDNDKELFSTMKDTNYNNLHPPIPTTYSAKERYDNFQSSLDLVSIHEEPSTLSSYIFDYDLNSFYEVDVDSLDATDIAREEKSEKLLHPLLQDLKSYAGGKELKKGLIYAEIMQRKY